MKLCNELKSKRKYFHSEEGSHRLRENLHSVYICIKNTKKTTPTVNDKREKKRMNYKRKKKTTKSRQR